jgi:acetyl esterase/lipase
MNTEVAVGQVPDLPRNHLGSPARRQFWQVGNLPHGHMKMTRRSFAAAVVARVAMSQDILTLPPPKPDARIAYGEDPNQFGELRVPTGKGPHPVVIFIHGGYWRAMYDLTHAGHLCAALTGAGFATWSLEYRRVGQPGGGWPGTMEDVRRGALHLQKLAKSHHLDLKRTILSGHSAGGQLALWLAAQSALPLRVVVPLAAVSDLRRAASLNLSNGIVAQYLGGTPEQVPDRYATSSPTQLLPISVRQRVIHGTKDDVVPFEMSQEFARASRNATLVPIEGAGHFELIDPRSEAWPIVLRNLTP